MKAKISIAAGFLLGAGLLYLAFRNMEFRKLAEIYSEANPLFLLPFAFITVLELLTRAARWRLLLKPSGGVRLRDAFRLEAAGLALSNILPLRLGEVARGTFASKVFGLPMVTVFATILVERALDVIVLALLFAAAVKLGGISGVLAGHDGALWTVFGAIAAALAALVFAEEIASHAWFSGFFARFPRVKGLFEKLGMGIRAFRNPADAVLIMLLAAVQWLLNSLNYYLIALAFGLGGVVNIFKGVALIFTGAMAASVPGPPGYFGNFEFALQKVLVVWGVAPERGFAYASYLHVAAYILVTIIGTVFVYQMGHSLGKVWGEFSGAGEGK
jgi:uncharacterized protein (TIRG00374 family)